MPRYFFNVHDGHCSLDQEGTEISSLSEVRVTAIKLAGDILRDEAERMKPGEVWRLQVVHEAGAVVFEILINLKASEGDERSTL